MLKFIIALFFLAFNLNSTVRAKSLELKNNNRSIYIQEKSKWTRGKDLFGMPYIYFSPQVKTFMKVEVTMKNLITSSAEEELSSQSHLGP